MGLRALEAIQGLPVVVGEEGAVLDQGRAAAFFGRLKSDKEKRGLRMARVQLLRHANQTQIERLEGRFGRGHQLGGRQPLSPGLASPIDTLHVVIIGARVIPGALFDFSREAIGFPKGVKQRFGTGGPEVLGGPPAGFRKVFFGESQPGKSVVDLLGFGTFR